MVGKGCGQAAFRRCQPDSHISMNRVVQMRDISQACTRVSMDQRCEVHLYTNADLVHGDTCANLWDLWGW